MITLIIIIIIIDDRVNKYIIVYALNIEDAKK